MLTRAITDLWLLLQLVGSQESFGTKNSNYAREFVNRSVLRCPWTVNFAKMSMYRQMSRGEKYIRESKNKRVGLPPLLVQGP